MRAAYAAIIIIGLSGGRPERYNMTHNWGANFGANEKVSIGINL